MNTILWVLVASTAFWLGDLLLDCAFTDARRKWPRRVALIAITPATFCIWSIVWFFVWLAQDEEGYPPRYHRVWLDVWYGDA